jgi:hypothetical protein
MIAKNQQNERVAFLQPKEELIQALVPLQRISWINKFIQKIKSPDILAPKGKNANAEKFLLGLTICLCLCMKNQSSLMRHGKQLKLYTMKYAEYILPQQNQQIISRLNKFIKSAAAN